MTSVKGSSLKIININVTYLMAIGAYDFGDLKVDISLLQLAFLPGNVLAILLSRPHLGGGILGSVKTQDMVSDDQGIMLQLMSVNISSTNKQ